MPSLRLARERRGAASNEFTGAIFAFLAAGIFSSVEEAQRRLCPAYRVITPEPAAVAVYERLYALYCDLYFSTAGSASPNGGIPQVLRELGDIARVR